MHTWQGVNQIAARGDGKIAAAACWDGVVRVRACVHCACVLACKREGGREGGSALARVSWDSLAVCLFVSDHREGGSVAMDNKEGS